MESQPSSAAGRGHARNKSVTKSSRPRSSTKGPLDLADDPLAASLRPQPSPGPQALLSPSGPRPTSAQPSPLLRSPVRSPVRSPAPPQVSLPKDFGFLLRPEIYHPLTPLNVPLPFRNAPNQPSPETPIPELLAGGHFRAAAIAAVQELTATGPNSAGQSPPDPADHRRIFQLLHTRLTCLVLIDATPLAAQEVKALEDLNNAALYVDEATGEHLVPWELRVLNVRLQALGFGDPRRSVMAYHDLAREAREHVIQANARRDASAKELWKARLHDLGVQVAGALIEMDDLAGAANHLATMRDRGDGRMALAKALLWLHLGDADAASACVASEADGPGASVVAALRDMSDGEYEAALKKWLALRKEMEDEMVGVNTAVCLLYLGRMDEGRDILESLIDEAGFGSHTLLFNLSTIYELCTERNRGLKIRLAERMAAKEPSARGWEKSNADFKL